MKYIPLLLLLLSLLVLPPLFFIFYFFSNTLLLEKLRGWILTGIPSDVRAAAACPIPSPSLCIFLVRLLLSLPPLAFSASLWFDVSASGRTLSICRSVGLCRRCCWGQSLSLSPSLFCASSRGPGDHRGRTTHPDRLRFGDQRMCVATSDGVPGGMSRRPPLAPSWNHSG